MTQMKPKQKNNQPQDTPPTATPVSAVPTAWLHLLGTDHPISSVLPLVEGEAASSPKDGSDLEKIYLLCLDHDKEKKKKKKKNK